MPADLHVHTTASDGTESPERVVRLAHALGLDAVGITDHDTVCGVAPAQEAARSLDLEVVPGIEINTDYQGREIHILGYYIDPGDAAFRARIRELAGARARRVERIVDRLRSLGLAVTMDDVLRVIGGASPGRPHVAATLVRLGIVGDRQEAFDRLIGRGCPGYVPREKFSPVEAISLIRRAGGVPVLAHPATAEADHLIPELVQAGLAGLEVYHPEHGAAQVVHYREVAAKFRLLATGGSDFHGYAIHAHLGEVVVPTEVVAALKLQART